MIINSYEMDSEEMEMTAYERYDSCIGEVTSKCAKGMFLRLDNGETAFSYFGSLMPGSKVLCTIKDCARENLRTLVSVDSVLQYAAV